MWKLDRDAVTRITIEADGPAYHLERKEKAWKITPLDAEVAGKEIDDLAEDLSHLRCERFEAAHVKDFAPFGLDKPAFKIAISAKDGKARTLQIGKSVEGGRFARLGDGDAVFVIKDKFLANVRKDALGLLDRNLLNLNPVAIERIRFEGAAPFTLESKKDRWQVTNAPVPAFNVSPVQVAGITGSFAKLRAEKFAAYGPEDRLEPIWLGQANGEDHHHRHGGFGRQGQGPHHRARQGCRYGRFALPGSTTRTPSLSSMNRLPRSCSETLSISSI